MVPRRRSIEEGNESQVCHLRETLEIKITTIRTLRQEIDTSNLEVSVSRRMSITL
jgi:hypothetical protein